MNIGNDLYGISNKTNETGMTIHEIHLFPIQIRMITFENILGIAFEICFYQIVIGVTFKIG